VEGWRAAIHRLRHDEMLRARLGRAARQWIEENASLDRWVEQVVAGLRGREFVAPATVPAHVTFEGDATGLRTALRESSVLLSRPAADHEQVADA
jgi:hypothetical protein